MNVFQKMKAAVCVTALMTGTAAVADVSAGDVWSDWQESLEVYGEDGVTIGSETTTGNVLTITDLTLSMNDELSAFQSTIPLLTFTENDDGTVTVGLPDSYPLSIDLDGTMIALDFASKNLEIVVSGDPDNLDYAISADTYKIEVAEINGVQTDMRMTANQVAGSYGVKDLGDIRSINYAINTAMIDFLVDAKEPGGDDYVVFSGQIKDVEANFDAAMPKDIDYEIPEEIFGNGFEFAGGYDFGATHFLFDVDADDAAAAGSVTYGQGGLDVAMSAQELAYRAEVADLSVQMQQKEMPFPISLVAAEYGVGLNVPLGKTDTPADFGIDLNLVDLAINEEVWMMIDPANGIPHDPVTIQLDLAGTGKLFFDLLDPQQADALAMANIPGELNSLTLENLTLAAAGAMVKGVGAFRFDNADLETFNGLPRPEGKIDFEINGANGLIDSLVNMGLLPEDQAMMGRMMMGMFARTVGDDMLTSTLEINAEGHVLANGQRIQ